MLFGLPGIVGYKAINTLNSMIGHRNERHEAFGWAAARIDDIANFIPARLTGLLFVLACDARPGALSCMMARCAPSPLDQRRLAGGGDGGRARCGFSGPRIYHGS